MTIKLTKTDYWILAAIGIALAFIIWYNCNPSPLPKQKLAVDSTVIKKYQADTAMLHDMVRNQILDREQKMVIIDSLKGVIRTDESRLGIRAQTINDLVDKIHGYEKAKDTAALLVTIDSLIDEVDFGIAEVTSYEAQNKRLQHAVDSIFHVDSLIKATLGTEVVDCNNFAFAVQLDVQRLRSDSAILSNKLVKSKKTAKLAVLVDGVLAALLFLKK